MSFNAESVKQLVYDFAENSASVDKKAYRILLQACSNEIAMSEYVRDWYSAKSKEAYTNKKGEEKTRYTYPHATDITNCRTSKDIVEAYYKAFETALDGENNDETVAYQEIHEEVLLTLCKYFVTAFVSCLEEQFGDSFVEFYCARVDYYEAQKALEIAKKQVQGAKQGLSRLENPKKGEPDADKIAAKKKELEEATKAEKAAQTAFSKAEKAYAALCE